MMCKLLWLWGKSRVESEGDESMSGMVENVHIQQGFHQCIASLEAQQGANLSIPAEQLFYQELYSYGT